jgi:hypothetical protein
MLIYGFRNATIATETIDRCPNCGSYNTARLCVYLKYLHICYIPLLPAGKTGALECDRCNQKLDIKNLPAGLQIEYRNLKSSSRMPLWIFTGIALIILITAGVIWNNKRKQTATAQLVLDPKVNDVFEVKEDGKYTLYKVQDVEKDSIYFYSNKYETDDESGLDNLKNEGDTSYSEYIDAFSKADLQNMQTKGDLINIDRK